MGVVDPVDLLGQSLTVGNLWLTDICLDLELALHAVNEHLEVKFAHTLNDGLAGFFIC